MTDYRHTGREDMMILFVVILGALLFFTCAFLLAGANPQPPDNPYP